MMPVKGKSMPAILWLTIMLIDLEMQLSEDADGSIVFMWQLIICCCSSCLIK